MKRFLIGWGIFMIGIGGSVLADQLLKNTDYSRGVMDWRGDRKVSEVDGEKVLVLQLHRRKEVRFEQPIDTRGLSEVELTMKVKPSEDCDGDRITLRFQRGKGGATFTSRNIATTSDWQEVSWLFTEVRGAPSLTFSVEAQTGQGELYFKDISITPKR